MPDFAPQAFTLGLVAAINPCGFALLPAYLSYFLGLEGAGERRDAAATITDSLKVAASMTAGFLAVFGTVGLFWNAVSSVLGDALPWVTVVMGVGVIAIGVAMLSGRTPTVSLPKANLTPGDTRVWSMFAFGVAYAIASLSCTIGLFIALLSGSLDDNLASSVLSFVFYGLGMGSLVGVVTLAVGFARDGLVSRLRRLLPHIGRISGALMIASGAFVVFYGYNAAQALSGRGGTNALIDAVGNIESTLLETVDEIGATTLVAVFASVVAVSVAFAVVKGRGVRGPNGHHSG